MKFEFSLTEQDYIEYQLFTAYSSPRIQKRKKNTWLIYTGVSALLAMYFFRSDALVMAIFFGILALACAFFYPAYHKWNHRRHYTNFVKDNYKNRVGKSASLTFTEDEILSKDETGEAKINLDQIEELNEIPSHLFLKLKTGPSFILPKETIDTEKVKTLLAKLNLNTNYYKSSTL